MGQACGHSILCRSQQYPAARPAEPRGQQVFLKPDEPPPQPCADSLQDALLSLGAVIDIAGLRQAAKDALSAVLPKVVGVFPSCPPLSAFV
ncbi:phosphodiesterase 2A, cGMP-stimulated, isoform CRA_c [Rattus norvegicus]|uniref:Phosphodiesterase 2A, cGMP-stimulated, isoform CRA_c n=1 Tax=Rattus norvegicus TaxID=10116 RepID=A6I6U8_RAT|nr:phosphodiesterase 2A, cGMP-stimulated, isoform CRA_c [Rattus norvegicus]